jgi:two-component system NtrC family sensor kinase
LHNGGIISESRQASSSQKETVGGNLDSGPPLIQLEAVIPSDGHVFRFCRAVSRIADAFRPMAPWREVLNTILNALVDELGYRAASVRQIDAERRTLAVIAAVGLSERYLAKGEVEVEKSALDREVLEGAIVDIADARSDARLQYPADVVQEGIGSILAAPLALRDRVIGVLRVYSAESRPASEMETHFLQAVGKLTAQALFSAQQSEALRNISRQIGSSLDMQSVLTAILRRTVDELNYKGGIIRLLDSAGNQLALVAATGLSQAYLSKGSVDIEHSRVDQAVLQGRSVTIYDVATDSGYQYPEEALKEGIRSIQAVPLIAPDRECPEGHKVIGVLRVYSAQPHRFTEDEVAFLHFIASLGALALQNALLYDELHRSVESWKPDEDGWHRIM